MMTMTVTLRYCLGQVTAGKGLLSYSYVHMVAAVLLHFKHASLQTQHSLESLWKIQIHGSLERYNKDIGIGSNFIWGGRGQLVRSCAPLGGLGTCPPGKFGSLDTEMCIPMTKT